MSDYIVKPVQKALDVLKCIGSHQEPMSLKDITICTAMPKTSVLRYLRTFQEAGMVAHDMERGVYRLDTRLIGMFDHAASLARLREISLPHMRHLNHVTGETVNLAVMEDGDIVYLEIIEGAHIPPHHARVAGRHPAHTTALGKAMLAHMPAAMCEAELPRVLRRRTERSINERTKLLHDLDEAMRCGFALDRSENVEDAICIGAPLRGNAGDVVGAISISAAVRRRSEGWSEDLTGQLLESAAAISRELSATPPPRRHGATATAHFVT
ncbi:IclR family transcriptional regulator [Sphingomonas sp.]|uniref:IclR family transcriptional regulator n=1 Tax=Sphingomonas sp. TaxID=28214 RepID=UPI002DD6888F|nr:IclR family transcriptional regulator [Sphingomonas sp.]